MELNKDLYIKGVSDYLEHGKNLLDQSIIPNREFNGITITNNINSINLNGTVTANGGFSIKLNKPIILEANKPYTFSIANAFNNGTTIALRTETDGSNIISVSGSTKSNTIIPTTDTILNYLRIYFANGNIFSNFLLTLQLEQGSQATNYEEYYGKYLNKADGILIPYTLYENAEGYAGTITLSDDAINYRFLEIYFGGATSTSDRIDYVKVDLSLSKNVSLFKFSSDTGGTLYAQCRDVTISGKTISTLDNTRYWSVSYTGSSWSKTATNSIYIRKVIGYK